MVNIAYCPCCGAETTDVTVARAASIMGLSEVRIRQFIADGRLPGSEKFEQPGTSPGFWKIPVASLAALIKSREDHR